MTHDARLRLRFASAEEAARLAASLAPDEDGFLDLRVTGAELIVETRGPSVMGMLRALDEALAALSAAQKAGRVGAGAEAGAP